MIMFKSRTPYFEKERDSLKCNTVRKVGQDDSRFDELLSMIQTKEYGTILIRNPITQEDFERQITDITYFDERFIISWKDISSTKNNDSDIKPYTLKLEFSDEDTSSTKEEIDGQVYPNAPKYRCVGCGKIHQDNDYNKEDGDVLLSTNSVPNSQVSGENTNMSPVVPRRNKEPLETGCDGDLSSPDIHSQIKKELDKDYVKTNESEGESK